MQKPQIDDLDIEGDGQPGLVCHIEIDNKVGKTSREINASTAAALRSVAAQIEAGELGTGFHPIKAPNGEEIGKVYLDHYENWTAPDGSFTGCSG
jgi:hypothetical protein